jgi:hypothetical protein
MSLKRNIMYLISAMTLINFASAFELEQGFKLNAYIIRMSDLTGNSDVTTTVEVKHIWLDDKQTMFMSGKSPFSDKSPQVKNGIYKDRFATTSKKPVKGDVKNNLDLPRMLHTLAVLGLVETVDMDLIDGNILMTGGRNIHIIQLKNKQILSRENVQSFHPQQTSSDICFDKILLEGMIDQSILNANNKTFICESQLLPLILSKTVKTPKVDDIIQNNSTRSTKEVIEPSNKQSDELKGTIQK